MRVMIAYPPLVGKGSPMLTQNRQFQWFHHPSYFYPYVPASAATLLRHHGHEVAWMDCIAERKDLRHFLQRIREFKPDILAMETKTPVVEQMWHLADRIKLLFPRTKIVFMGDHITALPQETLERSSVDYSLCGGDYDFSLLSLAKHLQDGTSLGPGFFLREDQSIVDTGPFELTGNLDELPWVDRRFTNAHLYWEKWKLRLPFMWTMAGRDCSHHKCTFCSWTTLFPTFRVVQPERLVDEMTMLVENHGARNIFDDTGTLPGGAWLTHLCEEMIQRRLADKMVFDCNFRLDQITETNVHMMKRAGFRKLLVGVESASPRTLEILKKGLNRQQIIEGARLAAQAGLQLQLTLMVGYPWETRADAYETLSLARHLLYSGLAHHLQATVIIPYPGTPLFELCLANDWFRFDHPQWHRFDMTEPVCTTPDMSPEEVIRLAGSFYKLYLHPRFLAHQLKSMRSVEDVDYLLRGVRAIWGHIKDFARLRG
ncbi:MAG: B12-binding domain-containing radical SAM protein [Proteobacteria bacterium]|jgi:anaerobic magnesium-protoporphyrin IX monomethyl ester cyclase|nr:B12-binding domain-containing radical SAM protein [Pseudomonadota bacterium]